jgi:hypothetical protein
MRTFTRYFLCLTLLLAVAISSGFQKTRAQTDNAFVVGTWTLTNLSYPNDGRKIVFTDATLAGTYYTNGNQQKRISSAVYKDGNLYFKIPELQLYFEMRKVGNRFDGKMTFYGTSEKRAPEPMRMTKN